MLRYHFWKMTAEGWKALVEADQQGAEGDPFHDAAWSIFVRGYDLPEYRTRLHPLVLSDLVNAMKRGPLPDWAVSLLGPSDFKQIKEVRKHDRTD